jgi:hypothetical protein
MKMKRIKLILLISFQIICSSFVYRNGDKCGLQVIDTYTQEIMGKNVGFYVKFKNNSKKNIDAFDYKVKYFDGFGAFKGTNEYRWQAGNLIDELEPNETLKDGSTNWVKGANKIKVQIIRVHYSDGTVCK